MKTFHGGIHPGDRKSATCGKPIVDLEPPSELVFPVSQHIGAPAQPCVQVGDRVLVGQKIAERNGFVSANIHSSVSGTVKSIEKRLHPNGLPTMCIIVENDGLDELCEDVKKGGTNYKDKSAKELIDIIAEAGIVGMGGATFPTHVKLSVPDEAKIDYVIINGAECEPYLTSDHRTMLENSDEVIGGLKILMHIFNLKDGYIGIESNKPDAIQLMRKKAEDEKDVNIHIIPLKTKYPQGAEKQLIYAITKRTMKSGTLPWQSGCIVDNIDTCACIFRAVEKGMPVTSRVVTLCGDILNNPMNYRVRLGTQFWYIIEKSGGVKEDIGKVLMGGPMMGTAVSNTNASVIKGTSGILLMGKEEAVMDEEMPCLRCAKCVYVCPMKLQPNLLDLEARRNNIEALKELGVNDCIECGSCAFVCPSKRRQVQQIKVAKVKVRDYVKRIES